MSNKHSEILWCRNCSNCQKGNSYAKNVCQVFEFQPKHGALIEIAAIVVQTQFTSMQSPHLNRLRFKQFDQYDKKLIYGYIREATKTISPKLPILFYDLALTYYSVLEYFSEHGEGLIIHKNVLSCNLNLYFNNK